MSEWMTIRVLLTGRRGHRLAEPPGRVLLAHADHTFAELAQAVDIAFGRYDLEPDHVFDVEGHRVASAPDAEVEAAAEDPEVEDSDGVSLGQVGLRLGSRFTYLFDPDLEWAHDCLVDAVGVDPFELAGEEPDVPIPLDGWGALPDQYGREQEQDDPAVADAQADEADLDDDAELAEWDAEERACLAILDEVLAPVPGGPPPDELQEAVARLSDVGDTGDWTLEVLWAAAGRKAGDPVEEPADVWLRLATGVVTPSAPVPLEPDEEAAWAALEPRDWAAAVIELVRAGVGQPADAETIVELMADSPDLETEDLTDEDEDVLVEGFSTVVQLWVALGALDEHLRLTELGRWGLPESLRRAWASAER